MWNKFVKPVVPLAHSCTIEANNREIPQALVDFWVFRALEKKLSGKGHN